MKAVAKTAPENPNTVPSLEQLILQLQSYTPFFKPSELYIVAKATPAACSADARHALLLVGDGLAYVGLQKRGHRLFRLFKDKTGTEWMLEESGHYPYLKTFFVQTDYRAHILEAATEVRSNLLNHSEALSA